MRRPIAIAFLLIYISINIDLQELARIPVLFEHFAEHKNQNREVSFVSFIMLHYFSGDIKDSDYQHDQQLPFKSHHCEEVSFSTAIPAESFSELPARVQHTTSKPCTYVSPFGASLYQFSFWQPPKA